MKYPPDVIEKPDHFVGFHIRVEAVSMTNKNKLSDEKLDEVSGGANVKIGGQDDIIGYLSRVCPNCGSKFVRLYIYPELFIAHDF